MSASDEVAAQDADDDDRDAHGHEAKDHELCDPRLRVSTERFPIPRAVAHIANPSAEYPTGPPLVTR